MKKVNPAKREKDWTVPNDNERPVKTKIETEIERGIETERGRREAMRGRRRKRRWRMRRWGEERKL